MEAEDEETKVVDVPCKFDDEDEYEDPTSARSCCGDGASKVSVLGSEQSKLPEP